MSQYLSISWYFVNIFFELVCDSVRDNWFQNELVWDIFKLLTLLPLDWLNIDIVGKQIQKSTANTCDYLLIWSIVVLTDTMPWEQKWIMLELFLREQIWETANMFPHILGFWFIWFEEHIHKRGIEIGRTGKRRNEIFKSTENYTRCENRLKTKHNTKVVIYVYQ